MSFNEEELWANIAQQEADIMSAHMLACAQAFNKHIITSSKKEALHFYAGFSVAKGITDSRLILSLEQEAEFLAYIESDEVLN